MTIIILLILSAITINSIYGENGIIKKALLAKEKTNQAQQLEEQRLKDLEEIGKIEDNSGISSNDILNSENKSEYYGAIVIGYECENNQAIKNWKIFYADKGNIYIIADDYIDYEFTPQINDKNLLNVGNTKQKLSFNFTNIANNYEGSSNIIDEKIQLLNSKYFEYLKQNNSNGTTDNVKAVAFLLDTNSWNKFKGKGAEYAIGAPTIEMLLNSYNEKYGVNYQTRVNNNIGYQISIDGGSNWATNFASIIDINDSLYVLNNTEKASAMWLASPSSSNSILDVDCYGYIYDNYSYSSTYTGIRPVVCLKGSVKLEKIEEGKYRIK